jgi:hypothetical protein
MCGGVVPGPVLSPCKRRLSRQKSEAKGRAKRNEVQTICGVHRDLFLLSGGSARSCLFSKADRDKMSKIAGSSARFFDGLEKFESKILVRLKSNCQRR